MPNEKPIDLNNYQKIIYKNAVEKGFHNPEPSEVLYRIKILSEVFEAVKEWEKGKPVLYCNDIDSACFVVDFSKYIISEQKALLGCMTNREPVPKPEGIAVELVDTVMRILDYFEAKGYKAPSITTPYRKLVNFETLIDQITHRINNARHQCGNDNAIEYSFVIANIVRYFDQEGWDFESILKLKIAHNRTRSYRHEGE